jgi:hypothetical protein
VIASSLLGPCGVRHPDRRAPVFTLPPLASSARTATIDHHRIAVVPDTSRLGRRVLGSSGLTKDYVTNPAPTEAATNGKLEWCGRVTGIVA